MRLAIFAALAVLVGCKDPPAPAPAPPPPTPPANASAASLPPPPAAASSAPAPPEPVADLPSFDALHASNTAIGKTIIFSARDFKAMSNDTLGATVCDTKASFKLVRVEVDKLPQGTAKKLTTDTRCRRIYGKVTGSFGGNEGLYVVKILKWLDEG